MVKYNHMVTECLNNILTKLERFEGLVKKKVLNLFLFNNVNYIFFVQILRWIIWVKF